MTAVLQAEEPESIVFRVFISRSGNQRGYRGTCSSTECTAFKTVHSEFPGAVEIACKRHARAKHPGATVKFTYPGES